MVAPKAVAAEILKKRDDAKSRKPGVINNASFQVLGSNTDGFNPSLMVQSEGRAYLFNCGEGLQRLCYANRIKLTNLGNVFLTESNWSKIAGSYGLSLTLQDIGISKLVINSTDNLEEFFMSTRSFLNFYSGLDGRTTNIIQSKLYEDPGIRIRCIPIDTSVLLLEPKRRKGASNLIAYHCALPDLPGALDPQRCKNLNVPIGPKLGVLKSGKDIQLDNGTIIRSADVCGPVNRGPNFLVVDCPSVSHIEPFIDNTDLSTIRESRDSEIGFVVHFSPHVVTSNTRYRQWMHGFSQDCKHILICGSEAKLPNFLDSYRLQYLLNKLDSKIFPELHLQPCLMNKQEESPTTSDLFQDTEHKYTIVGYLKDQANIIEAGTFDRFSLRPNPIYEAIVQNLSIDTVHKQACLEVDYEEQYSRYKEASANLPEPSDHEPEVIFLGTGSAMPSKLRNTSCILVNFAIPEAASVILDCGEDSYGQLVRFYGPDKSNDILKNLIMIYISHHHADHHIGLIEILRRRSSLIPHKPVLLLIPPGIETHLNYYNENFENLNKTYTLVSTRNLIRREARELNLCKTALLHDLAVVDVDHCYGSCAIVFDFNIGRPGMKRFRLAYSGDARPSQEFSERGLDCDLLIHEATFDHRDKESALEKRHSTTDEAIKVARDMRAKFTILTHFSQRYPKIPYFTEDFHDTIGFAFDNMSVRCPSHFSRLPLMKNLLKVVFAKTLSDIDDRFDKGTSLSSSKIMVRGIRMADSMDVDVVLVKLKSNDGKCFQFTESEASCSNTLKGMLESTQPQWIQLKSIDARALSNIHQWCKMHCQNLPSGWDRKFLSSFSEIDLLRLLHAANFLDVRSLYDSCCKFIARRWEGMRVEDIRERYDIPDDLSADDKKPDIPELD